ncbi:MAG: Unknown protein [uncultured Sulfurovum sp.]|uniref:Uncharacterized protein n=1 Tax=uncultured Sulfurovum sp. TaxID=269237 RepID=A0A6S6T5D6_9BACT|nr:MAG: Unknown protein [uncultured Sulfurovum sp.]
MTKKVIITLVIILTLAIGIKVFLPSSKPIDNSNTEEIKDVDAFFALPMDEENLSEFLTLNSVDEENTSTKKILTKVKEVKVQVEQNIYHEIDKEELLKTMPHKKMVQSVLAIEVTQNSIAQLSVGDIIKLPALGQVEYEAKITKKISHKNGSTSVTGNLVGDQNEKHSVILTEGKSTSYASISTPEGAFEIQTINGVGYVYSVKDIENQYVDPDKKDILHPTEDKH